MTETIVGIIVGLLFAILLVFSMTFAAVNYDRIFHFLVPAILSFFSVIAFLSYIAYLFINSFRYGS